MGDVNKNVNLTFNLKDKASAGLKNISKGVDSLTGSTKELVKENEKLIASNARLNASSVNSTSASKNMDKTSTSLIGTVDKLALKYLSLTAVLSEAYNVTTESLKAYNESVEVETRLAKAIGYTSNSLLEYASAMQKKSVYDDDSIKSAMAAAGAFIQNEDAIKKLVAAAADFASATGTDLVSATELFTKSVASGTNALSRYGITMSKTSDETERLNSLVKSSSEAYGGMSEAIANTDSGAIKQLNNEMDDLYENIGKNLQPMQTFWMGMKKGALEVGNILADPNTYGNLKDYAQSIATGKDASLITTERKADEAANIGGWEGVQLLETEWQKVNDAIGLSEKSIAKLKKDVSDAILAQDLTLIKSTEKKLKKEQEYLQQLKSQKEMIEFRQDRLASTAEKEDIKNAPKMSAKVSVKEDADAAEKAAEEFKKNKLTAQKSLNDDLFNLESELNDKIFEGKILNLDRELNKKKEAYKLQNKLGYINAEQLNEALLKLDSVYYNRKEELFKENKKKENDIRVEHINAQMDREQRAADTLKSINEQNQSNMLTMISTFEDRRVQILEKSLKGRLKLAEDAAIDELAIYDWLLENKKIKQEEYDQMHYDMRVALNETQYSLVTEEMNKWVSATTEAANQILSVVQQFSSLRTQREIDDIDATAEANKESAQKYIKNKKLLDKELKKIDKEAEARKKEAAKGEQKLAMIASIINTAQAVSGALTMKPPPLGIAMAIIVGALGAVQTGIIASQAFAQGGIIQPEQGVPTYGDKTQVSANPGEMIINQRQQRNLLAMANGYGGGGGIQINETIVVQGNMDSNAIAELKQHREEWLEMLRDSNKQLKYRGYTYAQ